MGGSEPALCPLRGRGWMVALGGKWLKLGSGGSCSSPNASLHRWVSLFFFFSPSLSIPIPCSLFLAARLVRTESVPCDINNPLRKPPRYSDLHVSQTLPKTNKLNKVSVSPCRPISNPQQPLKFFSRVNAPLPPVLSRRGSGSTSSKSEWFCWVFGHCFSGSIHHPRRASKP